MSSALALTTIDDTLRMANGLLQSQLLPKSLKTVQQVFAIITQGQELGLAPWQSINSIDVIQGKPALKPQAMLALIQQSGLAEQITIPDTPTIKKQKGATVTMKRKNGMTHTETFTLEMAAAMETTEWENGVKRTIPVTDKYNWRTMPEIMLKWRAVSACARIVFGDVLLGMYTTDELDADGLAPDELRIEQPPIITTPQLTAGDTPAQDTDEDTPEVETTPELRIVKDDALPGWTKERATVYTKKVFAAHKLTFNQILEALGVKKFSEVCMTEAEADALVDAWLAKRPKTADAIAAQLAAADTSNVDDMYAKEQA